MGAKTKVLKNFYLVGKGVLGGVPVGSLCFRAAKECIKDVASEDLPSLACKIFLFYCIPTSTVVACVGAFCTPSNIKTFKIGAKIVINMGSMVYSAPMTLVDIGLAPFETLVFGEPIPLLPSGLLIIS